MLKFVSGMIAGLVLFIAGTTVGVLGCEELHKTDQKTEYQRGKYDAYREMHQMRMRQKAEEEETEE